MKKIFIIFITLTSISFSSEIYNDISSEHWAYRAIENLYENGILPKDSASFDGEKKINKYDLVYYLSKTLNRIDESKASQSDLLILEHLVYDFSNELNKIGFNTDLYIKKIKVNEENIDTLKKKVIKNEIEIEKLKKEIEKLK
ncbi:MAG: S-layer homology domain-containing protein [Fusobacteria bacterium]|nr:MAG: S-layer homology domain-containing protein [Fusobacteriota bacterium]